MIGYAGAREQRFPFLGGVRHRVLISVLAALLGLIHVDVIQHAAPTGAHGDFSTLVGIGGTRVNLVCQGDGPATVAIVDPASVAAVIDAGMQAELARSVRLCTIDVSEATSQVTPELTRLVASRLFAELAPSPYVIITLAAVSVAFDPPGPFHESVAGFVLVDPAPPATGLVVRADGESWPLPVEKRDRMMLSILSLLWPPDDA